MATLFAPDTRLMTLRGAIDAAAQRPGEMLVTLSGQGPALKPLRHARAMPCDGAAIRIRAGAVADGAPARDLLLHPAQAVRVDGALAPALALANGATVARDGAPGAWIALDLGTPDLILADGLALGIGIEAAPAPAAAAMLRRRAEALGWRRTHDPAPHCDGADELARGPGHLKVQVPPGSATMRLLSHGAIPAEIDPGATDLRRLGIGITALTLDGMAMEPAGSYPPEPGICWTDGAATLALPPRDQPAVLEIRFLASAAGYWLAPGAASNRPSGR